jgi:Mrp family chromosome partitioning ATPase
LFIIVGVKEKLLQENLDRPVNVYPQMNFIKYFAQIVKKHRLLVISAGFLLGGLILVFSYINHFTSSTMFRFQVNDASSSSVSSSSSIHLEGILGKTESIRDKSFNYVQSVSFYSELGKKFRSDPNGQKIIPIFKRSKKNVLLKFKSMFYETFSYDSHIDSDLEVGLALQKIISFKKHSDNSIIMYVRTGKPDLSLSLGRVLSPMVREVILNNETYDLQVSYDHLRGLFNESQQNLLRLTEELIQHQENQQITNDSKNVPVAMMEMEKEFRMARVEVQRYDLLIKKLSDEVNKNSTYSIENETYKYVDQISTERLEELNQKRDIAAAKTQSVERSLKKIRQQFSNLPESEQTQMSLKWNLELEQSINKDLLIKTRDLEGFKKMAENSLRVIGNTVIVPTQIKISKPLKFVLGFLIGSLFSLIAIYYYYDFFKVIKGQRDLKTFGAKPLLTSMPFIKNHGDQFDVWKNLPSNHHAMESFRNLMEFAIEEKVVAFVSSRKTEGNSFIVSNLAENLTRFGKKVLVVDTNFKRPTISKSLIGKEGIEIVHADMFKHDNESFIDRSALITEIKERSKSCDIILIDTVNLSDSNDALIAASVANATVVLASHLETYLYKIEEIISKLNAAEIFNYSFLLNKADLSDEIIRGQGKALDSVDSNTLYLRKSS